MWPFIITALTWLGRIGLAAFAVNEVKKLTTGQQTSINQATNEAKASGVSDDEIKQVAAATTYEQVEKEGKSPDEFWGNLSIAEQEALKFSPESLRVSMDRTEFLGMAQTLLWVSAGVAAGIAGFRGIPILLSTLAKLATARKAGATALSLMAIIEEGKIAGIAKVWIPGLIAGIASAGGWLTGAMANNLNDAFLWGRVFLDQAHSDVEKAAAKRERDALAGVGKAFEQVPKTRITMAKTTKPIVLLGTLFSQIVKRTDTFERMLDDKITDAADLKADAQANLNKWLATLPGRLLFTINIAMNPFDEFGLKQTGNWITMTMLIRGVGGLTKPIDTILLGPIDPQVYMPKTQELQTIQIELPKLLTAEEIAQVQFPTTGISLVDKTGNVVPVQIGESRPAPVIAPTIPPATIVIATPGQVQMSVVRPYIQLEGNVNETYARLNGRKLPLAEAMAAERNNQVEGFTRAQFAQWKISLTAPPATPAPTPPATPAPTPAPFAPAPSGQLGKIVNGVFIPEITPTTPTPAPTAPPKPPYVRYAGSPNIFNRQTGKWVSPSAAAVLGNVVAPNIQDFPNPRPEVKLSSQFAVWNDKDLTTFPV